MCVGEFKRQDLAPTHAITIGVVLCGMLTDLDMGGAIGCNGMGVVST